MTQSAPKLALGAAASRRRSTAEQTIAVLQAQIDAYRGLSVSLAHAAPAG